MGERQNSLPIIHVRGTNYEVGFKVGSTFKSMIQDLLNNFSYLNDCLIPLYVTEKGRQIYDETLTAVKGAFPQYIEQIEGTATGADVPFYKLFLLHLDMVLPANVDEKITKPGCTGCSTVLCNYPGNQLIGHNEDALIGMMNSCYILCAHIVEPTPRGKWKVQEEKFASICYAGHLPGFCMSWNKHGLAYSVNVVVPEKIYSGKIPRHFLCTSLLLARNIDEVLNILKDVGNGIADGVSINLGFMSKDNDFLLHNVEVAPLKDKPESVYSVYTVKQNETYLHCNVYKHLNVPVKGDSCLQSSQHREDTYKNLTLPIDMKSVLSVLGNDSDFEYPIFREGYPPDVASTINSGVFNFTTQKWLLYNENPNTAQEPLCKLSFVDI